MRVVLALGGNALQRRDEPANPAARLRNLRIAAEAAAGVAKEHQIVVTHGNGPQVGALALAEAGVSGASDPLDLLVAESAGMMGYLLERELARQLPGREFATLLTQVEVDAADPAFAAPTKPIGPFYSADEAKRLMAERSWRMVGEGSAFRRVVPSPEPRRILESATLGMLIDRGAIVICCGGGGIPVVRQSDGSLRGAEAVIDKDLTAALLAERIGADALLLLTDVPAVSTAWGSPDARRIAEAGPKPLRRFRFAAGSMGPKVEAACRFVERTGGFAGIGALEDAAAILAGRAGTLVRANAEAVRFYA